ncbi:hypothetical protein Dimus_029317 [Dionaea muscipula]
MPTATNSIAAATEPTTTLYRLCLRRQPTTGATGDSPRLPAAIIDHHGDYTSHPRRQPATLSNQPQRRQPAATADPSPLSPSPDLHATNTITRTPSGHHHCRLPSAYHRRRWGGVPAITIAGKRWQRHQPCSSLAAATRAAAAAGATNASTSSSNSNATSRSGSHQRQRKQDQRQATTARW